MNKKHIILLFIKLWLKIQLYMGTVQNTQVI